MAVGLGLVRTVRRLLSEGANVNALGKGGIPPIAFAYSNCTNIAFNNYNFGTNSEVRFGLLDEKKLQMCNLPILELLISHGADLTCEFQMFDLDTSEDFVVNPFCEAFIILEVDACRILLEHGAKIEEGMFGMAFSLLEDYDPLDETVAILKMVLSGPWIQSTELRTQLVNFMSGSSSDVVGDTEGCAETSDELIVAMKFANEAAFDHLLNSGTDVEVRNSGGKRHSTLPLLWGTKSSRPNFYDVEPISTRLLQMERPLYSLLIKSGVIQKYRKSSVLANALNLQISRSSMCSS